MKLNDKGLKRLLDVAFDGDEFYQSNALEVEFEPSDFKDFEKELSKFFFKLVEEQKPLPADMARLLNEHFWELG